MIYAIGILGGFVSGFFGSGGGLIILPALTKILKIDEYKARGTTLATILISILVSSIFYSKYNYFDFSLSFKIAIGGIVGGFLGAKLVNKISKFYLSLIFDIFLIWAAINMIMK
jgi:uncharacterized membrane protein YfcA